MKYLLIVTCVLCAYSFSTQKKYIKVELGAGFYYLGDSTRNDILFLPSYKDTAALRADKYPEVVWPAIPKVERFGYNVNYIMAVKRNKKGTSYWLIEKTQDPNTLGAHEEGERIALANVKMLDSAMFMTLQKNFNINIHPIAYYHNDLDNK